MQELKHSVVKHIFTSKDVWKAIIWVRGLQVDSAIESIFTASVYAHLRFNEQLNSAYILDNIECIVGLVPKELHIKIKYNATSEDAVLATYTEKTIVPMAW